MGLFGRSSSTSDGRRRPRARTIPDLNPTYFEEVQQSIAAYGGTDTIQDVASGIANAIANVSHQLFESWNEPWGAKSFEKRFGIDICDRTQLGVADEMIDWMIEYESTSQSVIETTLGRLREVLAKPG